MRAIIHLIFVLKHITIHNLLILLEYWGISIEQQISILYYHLQLGAIILLLNGKLILII